MAFRLLERIARARFLWPPGMAPPLKPETLDRRSSGNCLQPGLVESSEQQREFGDYANRFAQVVNFLRSKLRLGTLLSATYDLAIGLQPGRRRVARRSGPLNIRGRGKN